MISSIVFQKYLCCQAETNTNFAQAAEVRRTLSTNERHGMQDLPVPRERRGMVR